MYVFLFLPQAYRFLAINKKLGLSGRPERPVGCMGTCKVSVHHSMLPHTPRSWAYHHLLTDEHKPALLSVQPQLRNGIKFIYMYR